MGLRQRRDDSDRAHRYSGRLRQKCVWLARYFNFRRDATGQFCTGPTITVRDADSGGSLLESINREWLALVFLLQTNVRKFCWRHSLACRNLDDIGRAAHRAGWGTQNMTATVTDTIAIRI
jgi:hypothetical protein